MALNHSPKIITDGLVFAYDMANTKKSWKGSPTTNLFGTNLVATNATKQIPNGQFSGTYNGWTATGVANDNPRVVLFNGSITVIPSTFYTLSCLYWSSNNIVDDVYLKFSDTGWTESTYYIQPFTSQSVSRSGSFSTTDLGGGWKYCVGSFQTLPTTTTLQQLFFDVDVAGVIVFVTNFQLEQQTFSTPFVAGTRSNTQALIDLTGNNTITANSLTYASDGTFSFNGTNSYLDCGSTAIIKPTSAITVSTWIKFTTATANNRILSDWHQVGASGDRWIFYNDTATTLKWYMTTSGQAEGGTASYTFTPNAWTNLVGTYDGSNQILYVNGTQFSSVARTGAMYAGTGYTVRIGRQAEAGSSHNGSISNVKIYNRALSAAEVKQNFNALRGRYSI